MQKAERKKIMNKKRIFALVMVLTLVLTSTVFAFAEVQPKNTGMVVFDINRVSRTSAEAVVDITFTAEVDRFTVAVYLQKKVDGSWVNDTENDDYAVYESGTDDFDYMFSHVYSNLESGAIYRLKCVSRDYIGSSSYTTTTYSNQF